MLPIMATPSIALSSQSTADNTSQAHVEAVAGIMMQFIEKLSRGEGAIYAGCLHP